MEIDVIQAAIRLTERALCPMCEAFKSFQPLGIPDEMTDTVTLSCRQCGYIRMFDAEQLQRHAAGL
jgi:rubredoxin